MELLKLTNISEIHKDSLYYSKYKYRATFHLYGIHRTRYYKSIEGLIERLREDLEYHNISGFSWAGKKNEREKIYENLDKLEKFIDWRNAQLNLENKESVIRIEHNYASVFTNCIEVIKSLNYIFPDQEFDKVQVTEIVSISEKNVKTFTKEPKHKFRVYLRDLVIRDNLETYNNIKQILKTNKKTLFPSLGLKNWVNPKPRIKHQYHAWHFDYVYSKYFIDYDDESMLTYLHLMCGKIIGKTYKLEKRLC